MKGIVALLICLFLITAVSTTFVAVQSEPTIFLSGTGSRVSFNGAGFLPTDRTCYVSSPSSSSVILSSACAVQVGMGTPYGGFMVGNVLPGQYVIQVTGDWGDFAQAILVVNGGFQQQQNFSHAAGYAPGASVSIHASGMLPTDTTCQISSPSSPNAVLPGTSACVIQAGTGVAYGGFIIGNVLPGDYVIQITGNQGDFAQTVLAVS